MFLARAIPQNIRRHMTEPTRGDEKPSKYRQNRPSMTYDDGPISIYTSVLVSISDLGRTFHETLWLLRVIH